MTATPTLTPRLSQWLPREKVVDVGGGGLSEAHILAMDQILPPELSAFEYESLRQIAAHHTSHHVLSRVQSRLKDIGRSTEMLGSLIVTDDGFQRIAMNK